MRREEYEAGSRWIHRRARRQHPEGEEVTLVEHLGPEGVRVQRPDGTEVVVRSGDLVARAGADFEAVRNDERFADGLYRFLHDDYRGPDDEHMEAVRLVLDAAGVDGVSIDWRYPFKARAQAGALEALVRTADLDGPACAQLVGPPAYPDRHGFWHVPGDRLIAPCMTIAALQPLAIAATARQAGGHRTYGHRWIHDPSPRSWRILQSWIGDLSPLVVSDRDVEQRLDELTDLVDMAAEWFRASGLASAADHLVGRLRELELDSR